MTIATAVGGLMVLALSVVTLVGTLLAGGLVLIVACVVCDAGLNALVNRLISRVVEPRPAPARSGVARVPAPAFANQASGMRVA